MQKIILLMGIFCAVICCAMQTDDSVQEAYRTCEQWFHISEIRTIASHVERIRARKGSFIGYDYCVVQSASAHAAFNARDEVVNIHRLVFPGTPEGSVVARISFNAMLRIKQLLDAEKIKSVIIKQ